MSQYTSSSSTIRATSNASVAVRRSLGATAHAAAQQSSHLLSSLDVLREPLTVPTRANAPAALRQRIATLTPELRHTIEVITPNIVPQLTTLATRPDLSPAAAETAIRQLNTAIATSGLRLATAEQRVVADAFALSLTGRGFHVARHDYDTTTGMWATRGHEIMAVRVSIGGEVELDTAGCSDRACEPLVRAIVDDVEEHGVELDIRRAQQHGDDRGGTLIQNISRRVGDADEATRAAALAGEPRPIPATIRATNRAQTASPTRVRS